MTDGPVRAPLHGIAYRQARWALREVLPALDAASMAAVVEQETSYRAQGRTPQEYLPQITLNLLRMEEEGIACFSDPEAPASVAVRRARRALMSGTWEQAQQPEPITDSAASASFDPWARHEAIHAQEAVTVLRPEARITDSRDDRSLDHQQPAPSLTLEGGVQVRFFN